MPPLPVLVSVALTLQLTCAAGTLAGPWAIAVPTVGGGPAEPAGGVAPVRSASTVPEPGAASGATAPGAGDQGAVPAGPVLLSAPGLWPGDVPVQPLGVDRHGALQVPATAGAIGWWSAGPRPGEQGAAVVVGHVDLDGRAGVFARLARARPGAEVVAARRGGPSVRYRVVSVERYAKRRFPSAEVYGPSAGHELRLITCGGRFDPSTGHYEDNVVVVAVRA